MSDAPQRDLWDRLIIPFAEDSACKSIFDHLRNLGICGAVLGAGWWRARTAPDAFHIAVGCFVVLFAVWLFLVNQANAILKVKQLQATDRGWIFFFVQVYSLTAVTIVAAVLQRAAE